MFKKKPTKRVGRPRETFIDKQIINTLRHLYACSRMPVPTPTLADCLAYSDIYIRTRLRALETRGLVRRASERGGWMPPDTDG